MKATLTIIALLFSTINVLAQKQRYDVVSYTVPKGWKQQQNKGAVQLSVADDKTGAYAIALITKSSASLAAANDNFKTDWNKFIKGAVQVTTEPGMMEPAKDNGWEIISGTASYTDAAQNGVATLLTATGGGQMVSVVLMTNTDKYQTELQAFINSLELTKVAEGLPGNTNAGNKEKASFITGLWADYVLETNGSFNGMPQYTAGYSRKEYAFKEDGTYVFRNKQWWTKTSNIVFIYETGSYRIEGNKITIVPTFGKGGFWSKKASSAEWGSFIKSTAYKPEKTVYTFEIIIDPAYDNSIALRPAKPTAREGGSFNNTNDPIVFRYTFRKPESLIDNPPGFKTRL